MKRREAEVLLVEDNCDHAELICRCLRGRCSVGGIAWLRDGEGVLPLLAHVERVPRLILLDLRLPKLDGLDVLARLKGVQQLRAIPVVVFTTSGQERDIRRAYALGANGYLVKPETFDELGEVLGDVAAFWLRRNLAPARVA